MYIKWIASFLNHTFVMDAADDTWKLIDTYYRDNPLYVSMHQIDSYDTFVLRKLAYTVRAMNPITIVKNDGKTRIDTWIGETIDMDPPTYIDDDGDTKPLLPNVARMRNLTYSSKLRMSIRVRYKEEGKDDVETIFPKHLFGEVPIMLHSRLCALRSLTSADERTKAGECRYDQGGYFVIDGNEKVVISQERIATNQLFVGPSSDPDHFLTEGMIRCTALDNDLFPKTVWFYVHARNAPSAPLAIRVRIMNFGTKPVAAHETKGAKHLTPIPLSVIFRALGVVSDRDIVDHVCMGNESLKTALRATIVDGHSAPFDTAGAIKHLGKLTKFRDSKHSAQLMKHVRHLLTTELFPNMGAVPRDKARYLGYLANRVLRTALGAAAAIDRDTYMYKRVDTCGVLMANLFRDYYNDLRNHVRNGIDREYTTERSAKALPVAGLVNESNLHRLFPPTFVRDGFRRSFKGKWGNEQMAREGVVQELSRLSYIAYVSHVRRVNTPMDRSIKKVEPHRLDAPQWGMMCPVESPDGGNIGLLKHMAAACEVSQELDREEILRVLLEECEVVRLGSHADPLSYHHARVMLNNTWIGTHTRPKECVDAVRAMRRVGALHAFVSIHWDVLENEIRVFGDAGRCVRPTLLLPKGTIASDWNASVPPRDPEKTFDPSKVRENAPLRPIEYLDCNESNGAFIAARDSDIIPQRHTHREIHPCLILSLYTNTIPFANHNQAPRNVFSGQQAKQAVGVYSTAFNHRMDNTSYVLHYPQKQLVTTRMAKFVHKDVMANGENLIVAIATYTGYNQEDSLIVNLSSLQRGMFNTSYFKTIAESEDVNRSNGCEVRVGNPGEARLQGVDVARKRADWDILEPSGLPRLDAFIEEGRAYLGLLAKDTEAYMGRDEGVTNIFGEGRTRVRVRDKSKIADKTMSGVVDGVAVSDHDGVKHVKIRTRKFRVPVLGDKMTSCHGQKGVCGMLLSQEEMPFGRDGLVPDLIVNPHAFPSRMTIGHLIECVVSKLCCVGGGRVDGTVFDTPDVDAYMDRLESFGYERRGDEVLYNGRTGEQIDTAIFVGPTYYMRLKHMVQDKMNYRSTGPVDRTTRQPTHGRSKGGGLRIGEMETNAVIGHGIMSFVKESLMERSDADHMHVSASSGETVWVNDADKIYESNDPRRVEVPYASKMLLSEVAGLNVNMHYLT